MMVRGGVAPKHALQRVVGVQVLLEQKGRELLQRWRAVLLTLHRDRHRLRRLVRALWAVGIVFGLGFLYRHRKQIAASVRGGLNTLRRTAGNVNDLMFSSSSLASGLARDLRAYIYGASDRTPQSLRRLIVLMSSSEVQQTLHGTAHAILAAFFAARRREADKLAAQGGASGAKPIEEALLPVVDRVADKVLSDEGRKYSVEILRTMARECLLVYLANKPARERGAGTASAGLPVGTRVSGAGARFPDASLQEAPVIPPLAEEAARERAEARESAEARERAAAREQAEDDSVVDMSLVTAGGAVHTRRVSQGRDAVHARRDDVVRGGDVVGGGRAAMRGGRDAAEDSGDDVIRHAAASAPTAVRDAATRVHARAHTQALMHGTHDDSQAEHGGGGAGQEDRAGAEEVGVGGEGQKMGAGVACLEVVMSKLCSDAGRLLAASSVSAFTSTLVSEGLPIILDHRGQTAADVRARADAGGGDCSMDVTSSRDVAGGSEDVASAERGRHNRLSDLAQTGPAVSASVRDVQTRGTGRMDRPSAHTDRPNASMDRPNALETVLLWVSNEETGPAARTLCREVAGEAVRSAVVSACTHWKRGGSDGEDAAAAAMAQDDQHPRASALASGAAWSPLSHMSAQSHLTEAAPLHGLHEPLGTGNGRAGAVGMREAGPVARERRESLASVGVVAFEGENPSRCAANPITFGWSPVGLVHSAEVPAGYDHDLSHVSIAPSGAHRQGAAAGGGGATGRGSGTRDGEEARRPTWWTPLVAVAESKACRQLVCEVAGTCVREAVSTAWFCLVEGDRVQPPVFAPAPAADTEYRWRFLPGTPAASSAAGGCGGDAAGAGGEQGRDNEGHYCYNYGHGNGLVQRSGMPPQSVGRGGMVLAGARAGARALRQVVLCVGVGAGGMMAMVTSRPGGVVTVAVTAAGGTWYVGGDRVQVFVAVFVAVFSCCALYLIAVGLAALRAYMSRPRIADDAAKSNLLKVAQGHVTRAHCE